MFFTFNQNNSGGSFVFDPDNGISHFVIIEAKNVEAAIEKAENIGLYFDGDDDCPCCGARWNEPWDDGSTEPLIYGKSPEEYATESHTKWIDGYECYIHYDKGPVVPKIGGKRG